MRPCVCQRVPGPCSYLSLLCEVSAIMNQNPSRSAALSVFAEVQPSSAQEPWYAAWRRASKFLPRETLQYKSETALLQKANCLWAVGPQLRRPDSLSEKSLRESR